MTLPIQGPSIRVRAEYGKCHKRKKLNFDITYPKKGVKYSSNYS